MKMRIIMFLAAILFIFSCQSGNSRQNRAIEVNSEAAIKEEVLNIGKMHCEMCVASIEKGLGSVEGVEYVKASLEDSTAIIRYDTNKTNISEFKKEIEKRGYVLKDRNLEP